MKNTELLLKLGKISAVNGQFDKAIGSYSRILTLDPGHEMAAELLIERFVTKGDINAAVHIADSAIQNARNSAAERKFHRVLGELYLKLGNQRKAIESFEILNSITVYANDDQNSEITGPREAETAEDTPSVWNEFGLVMNKVGSYDDAVEAFEKGISLDPSLPYLHLNLAQVFVLQGKLSEALHEFDAAFENTEDFEGKIAITRRMIAVFKIEANTEMIDIANEIITALSVRNSKQNGGYMVLPISAIIVPERSIELDTIQDMIGSVRAHGIIQPLVISPVNGTEKFRIVAGKKRYYAAKELGLESVPAIVRDVSEIESIEISFHENLHNTNNDPNGAVEQYKKLSNEFDLSIEGIAKTAGVSSFSVANRLKATGSRVKAEGPTRSNNSEERELLQKMIGNLRSEVKPAVEAKKVERTTSSFEINEEIFEGSETNNGTLWYMDETPANAVSAPTKVNFSKLFSRASGILKANPQHQKVSA